MTTTAADWLPGTSGNFKTFPETRSRGELRRKHIQQQMGEEQPVCSPFPILIANGPLGMPGVKDGAYSNDAEVQL